MDSFLIDVPMPSMGATVNELNVVGIKVQPGDRVTKGQRIAELESDKSVFEFESPCDGIIRAVLAKGTPVDLHDDEFAVGRSAVTQMAHVGVHLTRTGEDGFELSVFRGFSESFWEWLTEQAEEFGYLVR